MLGGVVDHRTIPSVIAELEKMNGDSATIRSGAIYILKNELTPGSQGDPKREVLYDRLFVIPGGILTRFRLDLQRHGFVGALKELTTDFWLWIVGRDVERFRDRCDRCFWHQMVPDISSNFGDLADRILNTINEAIINYAEYSFARLAVRRRITAHLFKVEGNLAYVIIRPSASRIRSFDPLSLKAREPGSAPRKRGWGHTLLMERALFLSFDRAARRRGMMIIIGPDSASQQHVQP